MSNTQGVKNAPVLASQTPIGEVNLNTFNPPLQILAAKEESYPNQNYPVTEDDLKKGTIKDFRGTDLTGLGKASLQSLIKGQNLEGANLSGLDLTYLDLEPNTVKTKYGRPSLENANLSGTKFIGSTLNKVFLSGANLENADFSKANLQGANLNYANLTNAIFINANLDVIYGFINVKTELKNANLTDANFSSAKLVEAEFDGANLEGAVFNKAQLTNTSWVDAENILKANFLGAIGVPPNLINAGFKAVFTTDTKVNND